MRQTGDAAAQPVSRLEKDVVLDFMEMAAGGWVKVRHRDGLIGFVPANAVWGL
jgi:hypothetical protein